MDRRLLATVKRPQHSQLGINCTDTLTESHQTEERRLVKPWLAVRQRS